MLLAGTIVGLVIAAGFFERHPTGAAPFQARPDTDGDGPDALASKASEPVLGPDGEEIVFQVSRTNSAWGRTSRGFFIKARGEVWRFDSFDTADQVRYPLALPPNPRHEDLLKSYGAHPEMVAGLPAAEIAKHHVLAQAARNAPLVCGPAAADAGGIDYLAWVMKGEGAYSVIRLGSEGNVSCRGLSADGEKVRRWLQRVTGLDSLGLQLPARDCKARPCHHGGDCFSVTYCESVPDCNWCDADEVCVEGPNGTKHCSIGDRWRCNDHPCRCFGHAVCPGGEGDCREVAGGAVTCRGA